ncbi:MAG: ABC transporter ATP-binding protein [Hyphomicrobiales bacterium]
MTSDSRSDTIISLRDVRRDFGTVAAVDGVSFDIARGEFFSMLGPSGCGKTTLLRMLAGLDQPTAGTILLDGQPMAGVPANLRPTNMVFQSYAIFPHLNVIENVSYGLKRLKLGKGEEKSRVDQALALVKLEGYEQRGAHQLSGGQRQRVALARALVCRPKVLLLDEPLGALDKKLREEMQVELRSLQRSVGITFVFVTHDQEEALTLSDRIAVMARGKVLQIDSAAGLYEKPNCREVAEFIGTMNLFAGTVAALGSTVTVDAGPLGRLSAPSGGLTLAVGDAVHVAVRPEKLALAEGKAKPGTNVVAGKVLASTYLGDRSRYLVEVPGAPAPVAVSLQHDGVSAAVHAGAGAEVRLAWPAATGLILNA